MVKINYTLNADNTLKKWQSMPFNEELPYVLIEEHYQPIVGLDRVENGEFVKADENQRKAFFDNIQRRIEVANEQKEIQKWFSENDYKVNKIVLGEWKDSDPRWQEYIVARSQKRKRNDEIDKIKGEL